LYQIGIFNGFTGTVVDTSGILYNQGFGYADIAAKKPYTKQTVINIASISKVFIGVALMKAQEMGLLNLDDPINKHLPFAVSNPNFPNELITIRQLATHQFYC
jgi:CubicO group peptidase (beta-lactamase class C family)